ncbi:Myb_DNA-binding domain-containing protein [Cephalotus follicularis]|uniref:Myb_DNA-binding domain-containing protein n=1 Tax=Cephalotus follicularis TaxID=3775 RepID=A0A1Q3DFM0_CEPFO|nr:Myb_DNA-binding domain-containing protein [Cephalotus follicularis]
MEGDRKICIPSSDGLSDGVPRIRPLHGRTSGPTRRSTKGQWTTEEDEILRKAVQRFKGKNWKKIAECFKDRTDVQCLHRWQKVLNPELVKGPWSKEEDEIIVELVNKYGPKKWSTIAQHLPGRIGKQCRERWHNHLNPGINKEAWTQEEELALIRAHQIYGNRWAELTKFLPGRTDNAIKNHWNSSVKKKLDSYLASGLLEQFQGLPLVGYQRPTCSSRFQSSGDDSGPQGGTEAEEISECSQDSNIVGCSQSAGDLALAAVPTKEEFQWAEEESGLGKESSGPSSCSAQYYTSLEDVTFPIPEIPCQVDSSSKFLHQNFTHDAGPSAFKDYQFRDYSYIPSIEMEQESSEFSHAMMNLQFQTSMGFSAPTSIGNVTVCPEKADPMLISDDECCRALFLEAMNDECFPSDNFTKGSNVDSLGGVSDSVPSCPSNIQISEAGRISASHSNPPSGSDVEGSSCCRSLLSVPSSLSAGDGTLIYSKEPNQFNNHTFGTQEQQFVTRAQERFICTNDVANSLCTDSTNNLCLPEAAYLPKDSLKLVPVDSFNSGSDVVQACPTLDVEANENTEQLDAGTLCYEPPRFPSLDIPFFSCDLIQSGSDSQQEYSPLGIRQLMMSSMNCMTPFRLWDSPFRDDSSPDALLKSAAKTFTGTPSILKKRHRDLLSPLSDRRVDKKFETDTTSSLTREFSLLDVMLDKSMTLRHSPSSNQKSSAVASIEDKENRADALDGGQEKERAHTVLSNDSDCQDSTKERTIDTDAKTKDDGVVAAENMQQLSGVLVEHNMNNLLLFSPDQVRSRADRTLGSSSQTPNNLYRRSLGAKSDQGDQGVALETSIGNSPTVCRKNDGRHSAALENASGNGRNDATNENFSIFGETPFKRSIESPSAWKSPWFLNSFLPGPRIDTDITIEDIGYFMSPRDRSYDAIGLMKQLSEHTAGAYADALEVLGCETPDTILKERQSSDQNMDQEKYNLSHNKLENHSHLASNVSTERRILDFSECGTPGKGTENGKSLTGISFSSPSSYLLKGCR